MAAQLEDRVLDLGLNVLDSESTHIMICNAEPTAISLCTVGAANALGFKSFAAGGVFGSPAAGTPNGRSVASASVTDGTITTSGTAVWWAIQASDATLHARGTLSSSQVVTSGNTFTLGSFNIRIPNQ